MKNSNTYNNLEQAIKLFEQGFSVIPIGQNKKPLIEWKQYQSEKASREQLDAWWTQSPNANIGIVTGKISNLLVVDIDPRHGGSNEQFKNLLTPTVKTGGGGWHYYFSYKEGLQNAVGIQKGIDIRAEGGYVIAPPSMHESGNTYEWLASPFEASLLPLPVLIKEWLTKSNHILKTLKTSNWDVDILQGTDNGNRNNSAASVAGKLLKRFPEKEWETEAWAHLQNWNSRNNPPLSLQELRTTFDSIKGIEANKLGQISNTENQHIIQKQQLLTAALTYRQVEAKVQEFLPNSQIGLRIVLAIASSCAFPNPLMIWMLLVGVPSSGKTDLVRLIKDAEITYYLDNLTQNAFISGERSTKSNKTHDLLPLIDKKCLIIKDWTSIFSLDEQMTKKLLGDLVGIYDKEFTKFSSRRGNVSYESAFSQLGCITPATLNRHTQYMNMVGPRFLCYSMPTASGETLDKSYESIFSNTDRSIIEKEARLYTSSYLNQLSQQSFNIKPLSKEVKNYLRHAAELMSNCRGIVILQAASFTNDEGEDIKYYEVSDVQIEEPWRAIQQIIQLTKYLAFVVGKNEVGIDELRIIKEVIISSMPADRSQALRAIQAQGGTITAKMLADTSERSARTSRKLLDELTALKVLEKVKGSGTIATDYTIRSKFQDILLLDPTEFSSSYSSGNETRYGIDNEVKSETLDTNQELSTNDLTLIQRAEELGNLLQTVDKNSPEYAKSHKEWLTLRDKGAQLGLFSSFIPIKHEPWMDKIKDEQ